MGNAKKGECTWSVCGVTRLGEEIQVRVIFKGEMAKKFKALKENLEQKLCETVATIHNTDVVRHELNEAFERLPPEEKEKAKHG